MSGQLDTYDPDEWFAAKAQQYSLDTEDLLHPADVKPDDAEGLTVLMLDTWNPDKGEFEVFEVAEGESIGMGTLTYAYYAYSGMSGSKEGVALGLDREDYDGNTIVRFVPRDATFTIASKEEAVEALRDRSSGDYVRQAQAEAIAAPWNVDGEIRDWWESRDEDVTENGIPVTILMRTIVGHGIDNESPISAGDFFGMAIGGHKKADRGEYKGNLAVIEEDVGMTVTYGRYDKVQNPENSRSA